MQRRLDLNQVAVAVAVAEADFCSLKTLLVGRSGGLVVSALDLCSVDPSLILAGFLIFQFVLYSGKMKIN